MTPHTTHAKHTTPPAPPALKRAKEHGYVPRPTFWYDPDAPRNLYQSLSSSGLIDLLYDENPFGTTLAGALAYISQWCDNNVTPSEKAKSVEAILYLRGGHDAASTQPPEYYREPLASGWNITAWRTGPMAVSYQTVHVSGKPFIVSVRVAAAWFDETDASLVEMAAAYAGVQRMLKVTTPSAYLLGTPAQTGLDLLELNLPYHLELPTLPAELREMIQRNSPQGRNEVLTAPDGVNALVHGDTLDWLQCYDAKLMYGACLSHVPAGPYEYRRGLQDFEDWRVGFYRVDFTIPRDWHHIGLLPVWDAHHHLEPRTTYPWQPGSSHASWCTGAELQLAVKNHWQCVVVESITWPEAQKLHVMDEWRDKLIGARTFAEDRGNTLVATALRHVMIDALGAMARRSTPTHRITPYDQLNRVPQAAYNIESKPWGVEWDIDHAVSGWAARFLHPEIAAMVWGRARARLAKFALRYPVEWFILARTDGWWVDREIATLPDTTAVIGAFRRKESLAGPMPTPRATTEGIGLIRLARGKE